MIGIILLLLSVVLYLLGRKRWSLLLFVSFATRGLGFLTDDVIGIKNQDLAFVYTLVICLYSVIYERKMRVEEDRLLSLLIKALFIFLICSAAFSWVHYQFTPYQILQGGRQHFIILCYFFLRKIDRKDAIWLLRMLFYITLIHSVLYIIQVLTGAEVLPYKYGIVEVDENSLTGLPRYYNSPHLLAFFLYMVLLYPLRNFLLNNTAAVAFLAALFCTQGRTAIAITLSCLLFGYLLRGRLSGSVRIALIVTAVLLPFSELLTSRYEEGGTDEDIQAVLNGDFIDKVKNGEPTKGTLMFRFSWVYERALYLSERPLSENIFGLGMISDSQKDVVNSIYHFTVGLEDEETGLPVQLGTADIAYGNMLTQLGYLGGSLLLLIWIRLAVLFYKRRRVDSLLLCMSLFVISRILGSVSGSHISTAAYLVIPFIMIPLLWENYSGQEHY